MFFCCLQWRIIDKGRSPFQSRAVLPPWGAAAMYLQRLPIGRPEKPGLPCSPYDWPRAAQAIDHDISALSRSWKEGGTGTHTDEWGSGGGHGETQEEKEPPEEEMPERCRRDHDDRDTRLPPCWSLPTLSLLWAGGFPQALGTAGFPVGASRKGLGPHQLSQAASSQN